MPLARCPKCGRTFPNTLRECPGCGYSPFKRPAPPPQGAAPETAQGMPPQGMPAIEFPPDVEAGAATPQGMPHPTEAELERLAAAGAEEEEEDDEEPSLLRRLLLPILIGVAALALVGVGIFLLTHRAKPDTPPEEPAPQTPVVCAEGEHVWKDATCTEPKTCTVCGETEGEPLGHDFADNVCTRCGAFDRMFVFCELASKRRGDGVVFSGVIESYSPLPVKNLHAKVELFDEEKNPVTTMWAYLFEDEPAQPQAKSQWRIVLDDTGFTWKYWSVSIMGYEFAS